DGRSTPIFRQQRAVHIDRKYFGNVQDLLRQDLAVGDDDEEIRLQLGQPVDQTFVRDIVRLDDPTIVFERCFLDGIVSDIHPAALRFVGGRDAKDDLVIAFKKRFEMDCCEIVAAEKYDLHNNNVVARSPRPLEGGETPPLRSLGVYV